MDSIAHAVFGFFPPLGYTVKRNIRSHGRNHLVRTISGCGKKHFGFGGRAQYVAPAAETFPSHCAVICNPRPRFHHDGQATKELRQFTTSRMKDTVFEVEMQVHDAELDIYGVVNNAMYPSYINSARDMMLEDLGIGEDYWKATGNVMAISESILKYFAPMRSGDRFIVKVWPEKIKGVRLVMRHLIETLVDGKLVVDARATIVFLNKDYRPTRVFPEVAAKAWEIFGCKEQ